MHRFGQGHDLVRDGEAVLKLDADALRTGLHVDANVVAKNRGLHVLYAGLVNRKEAGRAFFLIIDQAVAVSPANPRLFAKAQVIAMMDDAHLVGFVELYTVRV